MCDNLNIIFVYTITWSKYYVPIAMSTYGAVYLEHFSCTIQDYDLERIV